MSRPEASIRAALFFFLPALLFASPDLPAADPDLMRVQLRNGAAVEGRLLLNKPDRLVLDLGFQVLTIPREAVAELLEVGVETAQPGTDGTYHTDPGRPALTVEENIERCAEAVVQVNTPVGLGSGFVIHPDGFVVTNHHVIAGEQRIVVTLFRSTDREMRRISFEKIRIVAIDPHADLALLKIERPDDTPLHIVPLGNSRSLAQGEAVFSIGSPLGFDRTVSEGIVSLRNREMEGRLFIQSTVQINPGNSGGPLFNLRGEVIGVTNMKIRSVGIEGLNFAIPAEGIKYFLDNADAYTFDQRNPNAGFRYFMISNTDKLNLEKGGSP